MTRASNFAAAFWTLLSSALSRAASWPHLAAPCKLQACLLIVAYHLKSMESLPGCLKLQVEKWEARTW